MNQVRCRQTSVEFARHNYASSGWIWQLKNWPLEANKRPSVYYNTSTSCEKTLLVSVSSLFIKYLFDKEII